MATAGVVKALNGKVTATDPGGRVRTLKIGDKVADNEIVKSAAGANVHIDFHNKGFVTLGGGDSIVLDRATLSDIAQAGKENAPAKPQSSQEVHNIEVLQKQIEDALAKGEDPSTLLEAAAAGGAGAGRGGSQEGSSFVIVGQNAARGEITPGFESAASGGAGLPAAQYETAALDLQTLYPAEGSIDVSVGALYENWTPLAHLGNNAEQAAAINISFAPQGDVSVTLYRVSFSDTGVKLYLDAAGTVEAGKNAAGEYVLYPADVASGIYVRGDSHSDADFTVTISADLINNYSGATNTITDIRHVVVDAVAQQATGDVMTEGAQILQDTTDTSSVTAERKLVNIDVAALFADVDGSETHTFTLSGVPSGWVLDTSGLPTGVTLVDSSVSGGQTTYVFTVDSTQSSLSGTIRFDTDEWSNMRNADGSAKAPVDQGAAEIEFRVQTKENENDPGRELDMDNNESATAGKNITVSIAEDTPVILISNPASAIDEATMGTSVTGSIDIDLKSDYTGSANAPGAASVGLDASADGTSVTDTASNPLYAIAADGSLHALTWKDTGSGSMEAGYQDGSGTWVKVLSVTPATVPALTGSTATVTMTVTQHEPIRHADGTQTGANDQVHVKVPLQVTDSDGDAAKGSMTVSINDDGPALPGKTLTVQEADLTPGPTDTASGASGADMGNDGGNLTFSNAAGDLPGSITSNGEAVNWIVSADGKTVTGYTGSDPLANHVLKLEIDSSNHYKVTLYGPLDNASDTDLNLDFKAIATDHDGDTASATVTVTVQDAGPGGASGPGTGGATITIVEGNDLGNSGSAITRGSGTLTFDFGKDGMAAATDKPLALVYSGSEIPTGTGVTAASLGVNVALTDGANGANDIMLKYTADASGNLTIQMYYNDGSDHVILEITIGTDGAWTYTQYMALEHPTAGVGASGADALFGAAGLDIPLQLRDYDGTTKVVNINVNLTDDIPSITPKSAVIVEEMALLDQTAANGYEGGAGSLFTVDHGADAGDAATPVFLTVETADATANSGLKTADGKAITVSVDSSGNLIGEYTDSGGTTQTAFTLTVNADGSYRFVLNTGLDNPSGDAMIQFTVNAKDGDGDVTKQTLTFGVADGDGPMSGFSLNINTIEYTHTTSDTDAYDGVSQSSGLGLSAIFGMNGPATGTTAGTAAISITLDQVKTAVSSLKLTGVVTMDMSKYTMDADYSDANAPVFTVKYDGQVVFTLTFDIANAEVTYQQYMGFEHTDTDTSGAIDASDLINLFGTGGLEITLRDAGGSTSTATINVTVGDSVPVISILPAWAGSDNTVAELGGAPDQTVSGSFTVDFGADGKAVTTELEITAPTGITSGGEAVKFAWVGGDYVGYTGDTVPTASTDASVLCKLTITPSASGDDTRYDYTFELVAGKGIDNPKNASGIAQDVPLNFGITLTDGDGSKISTTLTVNVEDGGLPEIRFTNPSFDEPGIVKWWATDNGGTTTPTSENALSTKAANVALAFADPDGDGLTITITTSDGSNSSITFTTDHTGKVDTSSFANGDMVLEGEWGQLAFVPDNSLPAGGQWVYTAYNKADSLNPNDFDTADVTAGKIDADGNGLDQFKISASDGTNTTNDTLTVTISAHDDTPITMNMPVTHDQASQVLGPFLDTMGGGLQSTNTLSGALNIMDTDSADKDLSFYVKLPDGTYSDGTSITFSGGSPAYEFEMEYGKLVIYWDAAADEQAPSGTGISGNESGAWKYVYEFDYASFPEESKNKALTETFDIRVANPSSVTGTDDGAYDPNNPDTYASILFDAAIVTTAYVQGMPRPIYDLIDVSADGSVIQMNGNDLSNPANHSGLSIFDNDMTISGNDVAHHDGSNWVVDPDVSLASNYNGTGQYGTWTIHLDGRVTYVLDSNSPVVKGLNVGETLTDSFSYTVIEDGKTFTSFVVVTIHGENDAPVGGRGIQLNLTHGFGDDDGMAGINQALATDVDNDDSDLSYTFYQSNGLGGWDTVGSTTTSVTSTFDPSDFGLSADYRFDPNGNLLPGEQYTQTVNADGTGTVWTFEYGWLVQKADGSFEFIVDRNNPDVIKLEKGETIQFDIRFNVSDGDKSDNGGSITVTINGEYDKLAVKGIGVDNLSSHFDKVDTDSDGTADTAVYVQGYQNKTVFEKNASGEITGITSIDGVTDPTKAMQAYGWAQVIFTIDKTNLVTSLDGEPLRYTLGINNGSSSAIYVKQEDGSYLRVGTLGINGGVTLYFQPLLNDEMHKLVGDYTEFYINTSGTPLQLYAYSSDNSADTKTPIDLDFTMSFVDDSPTITGVRAELLTGQASGQVVFSDIDTSQNKLTLWVEDDSGNLVKIASDGTEIDYSHGKLTIDRDGTFTYESNGSDDSINHNIRVVVDDGTSASQSVITIDNVGLADVMAVVTDDSYRLVFSIDQKNYAVSNTFLNNDTGIDTAKGVLNGGAYELSNMVIRSGNAADKLTGSDAADLFSISTDPAETRFSFDEIRFTNASIILNTDGSIWMNTSSGAPVTFYDSVSGATFNVQMNSSGVAWVGIANYLNNLYGYTSGGPGYITVQDIKNALNFEVNYQVSDAVTGELLTGTITLNVGNAYENSGLYRHSDSFATSLKFSSAMDTTSSDASMLVNGSGVHLARDNNGEDVSFRVATYDTDGNRIVAGDGSDYQNVRDWATSHGGYSNSGGNTVYSGSDTIGVPMYTWYNSVTGEISGTKGSGSDWHCIQVGESLLKFTTLGVYTQIGTDAGGNPIYEYGCGNVSGNMTRDFYSLDDLLTEMGLTSGTAEYDLYKAAYESFYNALRDLSEGQEARLVFMDIQFTDGSTSSVGGGTTWTITVTGSDAILGDSNAPVLLGVSEDVLLGSGLTVDILSGAQHTFVNGTDSTSRTDVDGWAGIEFASGDSTPGTIDFANVSGAYGELVWDSATNKYTYQVYADSRGDAVRGMVNGESLKETFNYTVYDKNGESDTGQTVITIQGKSDGISINVINPPAYSEGSPVHNGSLAGMVDTQDIGVLRYGVQYTDPDSGAVITCHDSASQVYTIVTEYGTLTFMPDSGMYTFEPNGTLQAGEIATLDIKVIVQLTSGNTVQDSGWQDMTITIHGINDAPVMGTSVLHATLDGVTLDNENVGAFSWNDVDNDVTDQAGLFTSEAWKVGDHGTTDASGIQTIDGDYGTLKVNTETGSYTYVLDSTRMGSEHRVVDEFEMKVTDPGSDGAGANAESSNSSTLTIYGVDGDYHEGTAADNIINGLNDGLSHIVWGGLGDDDIHLTGSSGENILVWREGDVSAGTMSTDKVIDFNLEVNIDEGDILDVRDLLSDPGIDAQNSITFKVIGGDTTISIDLGNNTVQDITLVGVALNANDLNNGTFDELITQIKVLTM